LWIRVQKYGKVIPAEQLGGDDLDENDVHLPEGLGDHFDILYHRLPTSEKAEIKQRIKNAAPNREASLYGNYPVMPAMKG
jgi:hypothetical protein